MPVTPREEEGCHRRFAAPRRREEESVRCIRVRRYGAGIGCGDIREEEDVAACSRFPREEEENLNRYVVVPQAFS